jgi:hypothetical protein
MTSGIPHKNVTQIQIHWAIQAGTETLHPELVMGTLPNEIAERVLPWFEQLCNADPRVMIIVSAQKLDDLITELLKSRMVHESGEDRMFGTNGPLITFSAKIVLAYRIGLIGRDCERFLQSLRRLRKSAAHSSEPMDLLKSPHIEAIEFLESLARKSAVWDAIFGDRNIIVREMPAYSIYASMMVTTFNAEAAILHSKPFSIEHRCGFSHISGVAESTDAAPISSVQRNS